MKIIIISAFLSLALVILGAFKNTIEEKWNKCVVMGICITGILYFVLTVYSSHNNLLEKEKQEKRESTLLLKIEEYIDSISEHEKEKISLKHTNDSLYQALNDMMIKQRINQEPILSKYINLSAQESVYLNGKLEKGMRTVITQSNCSQNVALMHSNTPYPICAGSCEIIVDTEGFENHSFFVNRGRSPCGMMIQIFDSPDAKEWNNDLSLALDLSDPNINRQPTEIICPFDDLELDGKWQLTLFYDVCQKKPEWNDKLTVFFEINNFYLDTISEKGYCIEGHKYGEDYGATYTRYSKKFKLNLKNGSIVDCKLKLPLNNNEGYYLFSRVTQLDKRVKLYGTFYSNLNECEGFIEMTKVR